MLLYSHWCITIKEIVTPFPLCGLVLWLLGGGVFMREFIVKLAHGYKLVMSLRSVDESSPTSPSSAMS